MLFIRIYPLHLSSSLKGKICLFVILISYLFQLLDFFFFYWSLQKSNMFISFNQILGLVALSTGFIFFIHFCFNLYFFWWGEEGKGKHHFKCLVHFQHLLLPDTCIYYRQFPLKNHFGSFPQILTR